MSRLEIGGRKLCAMSTLRTPEETDGTSGNQARVLVACSMIEDELREVLDRVLSPPRVIWIERGFHERPERLNHELQRAIDEAEQAGAQEILLAFGLCGNALVGLHARSARLCVPRFDDCINMLLCRGARMSRALSKPAVMYLTAGWMRDEPELLGQRENYVRHYGERKADRLMRMMYGSYRKVSLVDTGCYSLGAAWQRARQYADTLGVDCTCERGSIEVLEQLVAGAESANIISVEPGRPIRQADFDFRNASTD